MPDKGAFTADLSDALAQRRTRTSSCIHGRICRSRIATGTTVAATLERADPRDVLLVRRDVVARAAAHDHDPLVIAAPGLAARAGAARAAAVARRRAPVRAGARQHRRRASRGSIEGRRRRARRREGRARSPARLRCAVRGGRADGARAARSMCVDGAAAARRARRARAGRASRSKRRVRIAICRRARGDLPSADLGGRPRRSARCSRRHGGGCHEALGATVLPREYGRVVSINGRLSTGASEDGWSLDRHRHRAAAGASRREIWPRPDERQRATRRPLEVAAPTATAPASGLRARRRCPTRGP